MADSKVASGFKYWFDTSGSNYPAWSNSNYPVWILDIDGELRYFAREIPLKNYARTVRMSLDHGGTLKELEDALYVYDHEFRWSTDLANLRKAAWELNQKPISTEGV